MCVLHVPVCSVIVHIVHNHVSLKWHGAKQQCYCRHINIVPACSVSAHTLFTIVCHYSSMVPDSSAIKHHLLILCSSHQYCCRYCSQSCVSLQWHGASRQCYCKHCSQSCATTVGGSPSTMLLHTLLAMLRQQKGMHFLMSNGSVIVHIVLQTFFFLMITLQIYSKLLTSNPSYFKLR